MVDIDFDRILQERAQAAQQHPAQSPARQKILNHLVSGIMQSQRLGHPQRGSWPPALYEDLYNEALQRTLLEICQKIENYNPQHPVMAWVNFLLGKYFIGVVNDYRRLGLTYLPTGDREQPQSLLSLDDLDEDIPMTETLTDDRLLRQFLDEDPEDLLKQEHLRDRPEVTFQRLAVAKFVKDRTWEEIAAELDISIQTLCSFFNRRLQKLTPYFRKYLQE
jgi:DNA-directed RNA polymerase specialized sigma24 family protein